MPARAAGGCGIDLPRGGSSIGRSSRRGKGSVRQSLVHRPGKRRMDSWARGGAFGTTGFAPERGPEEDAGCGGGGAGDGGGRPQNGGGGRAEGRRGAGGANSWRGREAGRGGGRGGGEGVGGGSIVLSARVWGREKRKKKKWVRRAATTIKEVRRRIRSGTRAGSAGL